MKSASNIIPIRAFQRWHGVVGDPLIPLLGTMGDKLALALSRRNLVDRCSAEDSCAVSALLLSIMRVAVSKTGEDGDCFLRVTAVGNTPLPLTDANAGSLAILEDGHTFVGIGAKTNATLSSALAEIGDLLFAGNFDQLFDRAISLADGKIEYEERRLT